METSAWRYYFDRIRINAVFDLASLRNILPVSSLKKECFNFLIKKPSDKAAELGSKSCIELFAPSQDGLKLLHNAIKQATDLKQVKQEDLYYDISYTEIARDRIAESFYDAEAKFFKRTRTLRRKGSTYFFKRCHGPAKNSGHQYGLFSNFTNYYGRKPFKYVIYPRCSKIDNYPCLHEEWRISRSSTIRQKSGIRAIDDFINFNFVAFFKIYDCNFVHEDIDMDMLAR
jgi:hypothetical protein